MCLGTSGSVRAMRMPNCEWCPPLVQIFEPLITYSSPSRTARVARLARSLPESGSLNSWHQISSPRKIGSRNRCFLPVAAGQADRGRGPADTDRVGRHRRAHHATTLELVVDDQLVDRVGVEPVRRRPVRDDVARRRGGRRSRAAGARRARPGRRGGAGRRRPAGRSPSAQSRRSPDRTPTASVRPGLLMPRNRWGSVPVAYGAGRWGGCCGLGSTSGVTTTGRTSPRCGRSGMWSLSTSQRCPPSAGSATSTGTVLAASCSRVSGSRRSSTATHRCSN